MIALCPLRTTLAGFITGDLLSFAMKLLNLPADGTFSFGIIRRILREVIGDDTQSRTVTQSRMNWVVTDRLDVVRVPTQFVRHSAVHTASVSTGRGLAHGRGRPY